MCGIVGMVVKHGGGLFRQTEDVFLQMLYADALRGEDSTGIIGVERDSTFHIAKSANTAEYFAWQYEKDHKGMKEAMFQKGKAYIGHNRKKTSGAISDENAHPFVVENDFAMVHNGTLYGHEKLATNCDVDSEALAIHLRHAIRSAGDSMGKIKLSLNDALGEVNGAYALAFYDQATHRVYLLRNKDRPLALFEVDNAFYFMSEPLMGAWILNRNNYAYDKLKAEAVKEHELIMFDMDNPNFARMYREQLEPKKVSSSSTKQGHSWQGGSHGSTTPHGGKTSKTKQGTKTSAGKGKPMEGEKNLKKFRDKYLGTRVAFWADDYCERNIGRTVDRDGEAEITLMAGLEDVNYWHTVIAEVNLHKLGMRYAEDIDKNKWTGVVGAIGVTKTGVIQIYVENAKPMVESKNILTLIQDWKKPPVSDNIEAQKAFRGFLGKMTNDELDGHYEEHKHSWHIWQISCANAERSWRMSVQSVEMAAQICADHENGFVLKQEERDGHFVYLGAEGRVYYESAITLH